MTPSLRRLSRLRQTLERQSARVLAQAEADLVVATAAVSTAQARLLEHAQSGAVSATTLAWDDAVSCIACQTVSLKSGSRDAVLATHRQRHKECRQTDRLVERQAAKDRRVELRLEQGLSDEWATQRRGK